MGTAAALLATPEWALPVWEEHPVGVGPGSVPERVARASGAVRADRQRDRQQGRRGSLGEGRGTGGARSSLLHSQIPAATCVCCPEVRPSEGQFESMSPSCLFLTWLFSPEGLVSSDARALTFSWAASSTCFSFS